MENAFSSGFRFHSQQFNFLNTRGCTLDACNIGRSAGLGCHSKNIKPCSFPIIQKLGEWTLTKHWYCVPTQIWVLPLQEKARLRSRLVLVFISWGR
eukprot:5728601-Amphidinium_carterae.1